MNVAILTLGTRGDVQPYVALGAGLAEAGHEVTLVTGKGFEGLVAGRGLRFAALDVDPLELAQSREGKAALRSPRAALRVARGLMPAMRAMLVAEWETVASLEADAVVYHPKALGGYHVAEALGVPGFLALASPALSPTREFPNPLLPLPDLGGTLNRLSYGAFFRSMTLPYRRMVNRWREETLGLPALPLSASELELRGEPVPRLYPCSPRVVPVPADWDAGSTMTGYWFLDQGNGWQPPEDLTEFLQDRPPPVFVGFGSAAPDPGGSRAAAIAALEGLGLRGVLATGRRGTAGPGIIEIEGAPHDWLFPRMAAVVHHGGAGTTAEGLRAGKPTAVFPSNFGDQLFWGKRVRALGAGPEPVPQRRLTAEGLAVAIRAITEDGRMRRRAAEVGEEIRAEDGVARAVEIVAGRTSEGTPYRRSSGDEPSRRLGE
jgi:UDP:flavonoid glycosyltransferase YjiC (YdhE family)